LISLKNSEDNLMRKILSSLAVLIMIFTCQLAIHAQTPTGNLNGTVVDPSGALVPGATVTVRNNATGLERTATTNNNGQFNIAALPPGTYTVTVEGAGFKRAVAPNVVVEVSQTAEISVAMELGLASETVTVTAAQEVINSTTPNISNTISTRQVADLPLTGRNPLELAGLQAGIGVIGSDVRGASVGGLRQTTTNVSQDGINAMDNFVKTSSFFAISAPSINSISEFSITTNTVGSDQGRGVGQVNMVTRSGTNRFSGGVFYHNINDYFQANSFFNNATGTPRPRQNQHFFGGDIGGPVPVFNFGEGGPMFLSGKDRAHFFFSYEGFREKFQATRNRVVLSPEARQGIFRYTGTDGVQRSVNIFDIGVVNTPNPITAALIAQTPLPNNNLVADPLNTGGFRFNVSGDNQNDKYVFRYDHHLVKQSRFGAHKLEFVFNRATFFLGPDTFNALEAPFPGGTNAFQSSTRWLITPALISTFGNMTNSLRFGRQWSPVGFLRESDPDIPFIFFSGITNPQNTFMSQGRDTVVEQLKDDFTMPKGNHLFKFGFDYQRVFAESFNDAGINQSIVLGTNALNPSGVTLTDLPFGTNADVSRATSLYLNLTGNLGSAQRTFNVTSPTSGFVTGATRLRLLEEKDYALYGQDTWRVRPNMTLSYGLRWDFIGVPKVPDGVAIQVTNTCDLYGISGCGNLFNPNAPAGPPPAVATLDFVSGTTGRELYNNDWNNFAPFVGIAYSPDFRSGLLRGIFGSPGRSAIRAGYSISYVREGFTVFSNTLGVGTTNPGLIQTAANTTPTGVLTDAGVPLTTPTFTMPITDRQNHLINVNNGLWAVDPNLKIPYVHQWNVGVEREIFPNTALEIRYVGNTGKQLWRAYNLNEVNIFENGFLQEFKNAQINLAARGGTSFAPGCVGCVALPLLTKFFAGLPATSGFSSSGFISNLNNNNVGTMAFQLAFSTAYRANRENPANAIPANFFVANPNALFARFLTNEAGSNYHSLQVELRRRFSQGLQFQAAYTFSKALSDTTELYGNSFASQSDLASYYTLRNKRENWTRSPQDQTHRFVANALYELPFGRGKQFASNSHWLVDRLIGGWTVGGIVAWQTRPPWFITSGRTTFNSDSTDDPAQLLGISFEEFKRNVGLYKTPYGVFFINPDLLDIVTNPVTGAFVSSRLKPGLMGAPEPGTYGNFPRYSIAGPTYFNLDMSLVKRIPITETVRFELKTTFINILNRPNFIYNGNVFDSNAFGRITGQSGSPRYVHFQTSLRF
jgi:hypothetical protein